LKYTIEDYGQAMVGHGANEHYECIIMP
jgi:hypothetical protein